MYPTIPRSNRRARQGADCRTQKFSRGKGSDNCNETNLPIDKMAADETTNAAAGKPSALPDSATAHKPADKNNGRGKRGGRDRGNDKQKRKHAGFGSAKYAVADSASAFF